MDAMTSGLPPKWIECALGDVLLDIVGGGTPSKDVAAYFRGDIPLMTVKDMKERRPKSTGFNITEEALANSSARMIPADTVIIATRMGLGKVVRASFNTAINQDLKALLAPPDLDKSYLEFWLMSVANDIESMGTGTTVKGVRLNVIRGLEIRLAPLKEQRRIVEKIETLFARLDKGEEAVREVQKLLTRYRQSVLKAAVTGELTADWRAERAGKLEHGLDLLARILKTRRENWQGRGKYKDAPQPSVSGLPELPKDWVWSSLGQLMHKIEAGKNYKCEERPPRTGETGIVKISAVTWEEFDEEESKTITSDEHLNETSLIQEGDLLISRANTVELVGASVVVRKIEKQLQLSDKVLRLRLVEPIEDWVNFVLKSVIGRKQIEAFATGAQMSMRNISQANLERIAIPLPPPSEIKHCCEVIRDAHSRNATLTTWCETELKRSSSLRQSILKQAFSGKLVEQDPNDEPASALLARIKAVKAANGKTKTKKTRRKVRA